MKKQCCPKKGWDALKLISLGFLIVGLIGCAESEQQSASQAAEPSLNHEVVEEQTELSPADFHQALVTVDTHIDIPDSLGIGAADPGKDGPMQVDLPKMRTGGLDIGFFIVYVGQGAFTPDGFVSAYDKAQKKFAGIERMLSMYPEQIALARNPEEVKAILAEGKLVAAIGLENAYPAGKEFGYLQEFYDRGARYASLTHFGNNQFADSSGRIRVKDVKEPFHGGVSELGFQLIEEMNRLGIMVDVSHTSPESTIQTAKASKTPVIASHSGVRALYDHIRNMSDEEIVAVAEGGGVVQLVAFDSYMRAFSDEERAAAMKIREALGAHNLSWFSTASQEQMAEYRRGIAALNDEFPRASVKTLVDHVDYVVNLVGIDHAGISSDFGGGGGIQGWDHIGETQNVTDELVARGYSEEDIAKIWGGNLLRVWQEVEDFARSQSEQ